VIGTAGSLLYRRGNFNGTWDDLICDALISQRDAQIALSPGFRWGAKSCRAQEITREDIYNVTAMTYPNAYRTEMTGEICTRSSRTWPTTSSTPTPITSRAATWCGSVAWATARHHAGRRAAGSPT
jgi:hypothetical protein